jgi:hypothetical protein
MINDKWRPFCFSLFIEDGKCHGLGRKESFFEYCYECPFNNGIPEWYRRMTHNTQEREVERR